MARTYGFDITIRGNNGLTIDDVNRQAQVGLRVDDKLGVGQRAVALLPLARDLRRLRKVREVPLSEGERHERLGCALRRAVHDVKVDAVVARADDLADRVDQALHFDERICGLGALPCPP